ncbi:MAG TPA: proton-conducting transporter membrane subunit [Cyclobacteriaceae bacterium]|nr:proton-conducting transporter membrane subunit [Cyclobacteriaceae bacterium]
MMPGLAILTIIALLTGLAFFKGQAKGLFAVGLVSLTACLSSWPAFHALFGDPLQITLNGGPVFGKIPIRVDSLSGWFILLMNFTMLTGIVYGIRYIKPYQDQTANVTIHYASYWFNQLAMVGIYVLQNSLAFLCVWETMAISAFLLVIFEQNKMATLGAGINYLVQSHIGIAFLTVGFIWVSSHTGSYDFNAIGNYSASINSALSFVLFVCFFIAFAIKAGFVPFHTWLPYAHPAAPAHVSGVMSGVMIKLGIFGILRMLLLIKENYLPVGYFIIVISLITGIYGVMLAIIQHNLKKLLAYHSIENVGIIGIGIGLGTLGLGLHNLYLVFTGFAGALLHTLNHSLFKSLLFYASGTIYQAAHTMHLERLGGLIKKMPQTATLFLIAALAISGLPPLNGFISEFLIYSGLFAGLRSHEWSYSFMIITVIFGLSVIGAMAMLCFVKAFSIVFLGEPRHPTPQNVDTEDFVRLFPLYVVAFFVIVIGLVPWLFVVALENPISLYTNGQNTGALQSQVMNTLRITGYASCGLIVLSLIIMGIRKIATRSRVVTIAPTWGCGYSSPTPRLQYTANSFVRSYRKLIRPLLIMNKKEKAIEGVFPEPVYSETHPYDKIEAVLIDLPVKRIKLFMSRFRFLQNGSIQFYILYGMGFIFISITVPLLLSAIKYVVNLFKQI